MRHPAATVAGGRRRAPAQRGRGGAPEGLGVLGDEAEGACGPTPFGPDDDRPGGHGGRPCAGCGRPRRAGRDGPVRGRHAGPRCALPGGGRPERAASAGPPGGRPPSGTGRRARGPHGVRRLEAAPGPHGGGPPVYAAWRGAGRRGERGHRPAAGPRTRNGRNSTFRVSGGAGAAARREGAGRHEGAAWGQGAAWGARGGSCHGPVRARSAPVRLRIVCVVAHPAQPFHARPDRNPRIRRPGAWN